MRIALDVSAAAKRERSGIGWYTAHLARELPALLGPDDQLLLCTRLSRLRRWRHRPAASGPRSRARWFQEPWLPRGSPQVFHGPDARLPAGLAGPCALVATVHDVFSLHSDRFASAGFRERKAAHYADLARRAARLLFPSRASRDAYLEHFPQARGRAVVVPEGVEARFAPAGASRVLELRRRYALPERFALYVGEVSLRKNLPGQARGLAASRCDLPWVWAGADSTGAPELLAELRDAGLPPPRRLGYVPAGDLPALYSAATLLTFATHAEGFGLPALEAMACGTPAVVSSRGALPELTAGCAEEVDPDSPEQIGAAIRRLLDDAGRADALSRRGRARAAEFSWPRTARETLAVYRAAFSQAAAP